MGLPADDLPFVAELIDVLPQFEVWRAAAELALGGFAVTMLVDQGLLPRLRRSINALEMHRRLRFEGVPSHQPIRQHPGASILPGRFQFRDSAFAGSLTNTLVDRFGYACVDDAADLDNASFGLTITGQTRHGQRGAHGGHGAPRVMGSPTKSASARSPGRSVISTPGWRASNAQRTAMTKAIDLSREGDGHMHVTATTWAAIDVGGIEHQILALTRIRDELLAGNDVLRSLKAREQRLLKEHQPATARAANRT